MFSSKIFSPSQQSRNDQLQEGIRNFNLQVTQQMNNRQLSIYRNDVRNNVLNREPFVVHKEKSNKILGSWGKPERPTFEQLVNSVTPSSRIPGGLNFDEIFGGRKLDALPKSATSRVERIFNNNKSKNGDSFFDYQSQRVQTLTSAFKETPQKPQIKLEKFKSLDSKLDIQLQLQNQSISSRIQKDQTNIYKLLNNAKRGILETSNNKSENYYFPPSKQTNNNKQFFNANNKSNNSINKENFSSTPRQWNQRNQSSQLNAINSEKFPITDIIRMATHFTQMPAKEIQKVSKDYIHELQNLQSAIQRMVRVSNLNN